MHIVVKTKEGYLELCPDSPQTPEVNEGRAETARPSTLTYDSPPYGMNLPFLPSSRVSVSVDASDIGSTVLPVWLER